MNRQFHIWIISLVLLAGQVSCGLIDENRDDCFPDEETGITFRFSFTFAGGSASDIDPDDVKELSLYVFDSSGYIVTTHSDPVPDLYDQDYSIMLTLDTEDDYHFIAWANTLSTESYTPITPAGKHIEEWYVQIEESTTHHLLYGSLDLSATRSAEAEEYVIELSQNSYSIYLTTEGLTQTEDEYSLELDREYNSYTFLNTPFLSGDPVICNTLCSKDENGQPYALTQTFGLDNNSRTTLTLNNNTTNKILYQKELVWLIEEANRQGAAIDFLLTHYFHIHLKFDTQMQVSVSLNGWNITHEYHEL